MHDPNCLTVGAVARRFGVPAWQIRRLFERGLLPPAARLGAYRVIAAKNGRQGSELFEKYAGEIELVVSDVVMPELTGPEMAKRIRKLKPDMKFLFISGYSDASVIRQSFPRGAALLEKPFSQDQLLQLVKSLVRRSFP